MNFKSLSTAFTFALFSSSAFSYTFDPLIGTWKVIDHRTDAYISDIVIRKNSKTQQYSAVITQLHGASKNLKTCQKCTGSLKNQPVIGMEVLQGLSTNTNNSQFSHGLWTNPDNGYQYKISGQLNHSKTQLQITGRTTQNHTTSMLWIKLQDVH